jgi:MFS family permease
VTDLMKPVMGNYAGWVLVYTSAIMFVLRFCAGPLVHKLNPLGLLLAGSALACCGLVSLSFAGGAAILIFLAATLYGCGKAYFWPTTLGVVSEQFPKGGALTLNAMGGMGMIAVGALGVPFLGAFLDHRVDHTLKETHPAVYAQVMNPKPVTAYYLTQHTIDEKKLLALPASEQGVVKDVRAQMKQGSLRYIALLPATMFVCYLILVLYFIAKGGYRIEQLSMSGEEAAGGIPGPVQA